jgi:hypothetical protein
MDTPADRIRVVEGSLRCFTCGCLSLIPVLGLVFSVLAILQHLLTRGEQAASWNPARRYLLAGYVLAWIGGLVWLGVLVLVLGAQFANLNF